MDQIPAEILVIAMAAASIVKPLVDMFALGVDPPVWVKPTLAVVFGVVICGLLLVAGGVAITQQTGAQIVLGGVLAGVMAVGTTLLARRAEQA